MKDGESLAKTINGQECTWCDKCRLWTSGEKQHTTEKHKLRSELQGGGTPNTPVSNLASSGMMHFHSAGMLNCVFHVEWQLSSTCSFDWLMTYLMLPMGLMVLYGGFVKNVVDRLQFVKNPILQAVGSSAVSGINSIKWVDYATWLSQPEGARSMVLEAFPEGWLYCQQS